MMYKVFLGILAIFLLLAGFAEAITGGIKTWRTEDTTEAFSVTTAAGQTTANATLGHDLFQDDTAEVITITSNITGEAPIAVSYVTATKKLLTGALNPSATHTLTVNYYAESDNAVMRVIGPFLAILIFGFLLFLIASGMFKKH